MAFWKPGAERPASVGVRRGRVAEIGPRDADWSAAAEVVLAEVARVVRPGGARPVFAVPK